MTSNDKPAIESADATAKAVSPQSRMRSRRSCGSSTSAPGTSSTCTGRRSTRRITGS
jgi:hypothetical protein